MKLYVTVSQKINLTGVRAVIAFATNDGVLVIGDGSQLKQGLVKLCQPREVVRANVHMVELKCHSAFFRLGYEPHSTHTKRIGAALTEILIIFQFRSVRNTSLYVNIKNY
jgi:hypothetical protein